MLTRRPRYEVGRTPARVSLRDRQLTFRAKSVTGVVSDDLPRFRDSTVRMRQDLLVGLCRRLVYANTVVS